MTLRDKYIEFIREKLDRRTLLEGLAEECAELSKASLKLIRAGNMSNNTTPISEYEAEVDLIDEVADVLILLDVLNLEVDIDNSHKWKRWSTRLG